MRLVGASVRFAALGIATALATAGASPSGPIRVSMRDVVLYAYRDAPSHVIALSGIVRPARPGRAVVFDDVTSYGVDVGYARLSVNAATLTVLMNRYILPAANGPIRSVNVTLGAGTLGMSGIIQNGKVRVRFKATAVPQPTAGGDLRLHIVKITAAGFVSKGLLDALGLKLSKIAQPRNTRIFHVVGDDMIVPVISMFPPPKFDGKLTAVRVGPRALTAVLGSERTAALPARGGSYVRFRGGVVTFAKLTMRDTDLTVVPRGTAPLEFSPANYYRQLVAGVTLVQPDGGLVARVPNYRALAGRK